MERRRIDWRVICEGDIPLAKRRGSTVQSSQLADLTADAMANPSPEAADRALHLAVDFSRSVVQLERSGIFLLDRARDAMVGTWGTGIHGETVDEHALMYDFGAFDREIFARAEAGFPWTAYDDCPLIAQVGETTRVLGRGWVACTPIVGPAGPFGILFNDTALSRAPIDDARQARAVVLCSVLGRALELCRRHGLEAAGPAASGSVSERRHPIVRKVARLLADDPTLTCEGLAKQLRVSAGQLARTFKRETGVSVVDHRNELRLARFLDRADPEGPNMADAALDAGFGSYAQFHRVFRARFGRTPREYLLHRVAEEDS